MISPSHPDSEDFAVMDYHNGRLGCISIWNLTMSAHGIFCTLLWMF